MKNFWKAKKNVAETVVISRDQMWGLSQDVLYSFTDKLNGYAIPDNASFLNFSEIHQEILGVPK